MQYFNEFPVINYSITGNPTDTKEITDIYFFYEKIIEYGILS